MADYFGIKRLTLDEPLVTPGYDFGGPIRIIAKVGTNVVIHKPSYTVWFSRGSRTTDPARYLVGTVFINTLRPDRPLWVAIFQEVPSGRHWRQARSEAMSVATTKSAVLPPWGEPYHEETHEPF